MSHDISVYRIASVFQRKLHHTPADAARFHMWNRFEIEEGCKLNRVDCTISSTIPLPRFCNASRMADRVPDPQTLHQTMIIVLCACGITLGPLVVIDLHVRCDALS